MATKIKNFAGFNDRLMFIVLSAPDKFPKVGPFTDDQSKNLVIAFDSLKEGFGFVEKKIKDPTKLEQLKELLDDALAAYQQGEKKKGAHLLQDFQGIVFPNRFKEYEEGKGE